MVTTSIQMDWEVQLEINRSSPLPKEILDKIEKDTAAFRAKRVEIETRKFIRSEATSRSPARLARRQRLEKFHAEKILQRVRRDRMFLMRQDGESYTSIGRYFGISKSHAYKIICQEALRNNATHLLPVPRAKMRSPLSRDDLLGNFRRLYNFALKNGFRVVCNKSKVSEPTYCVFSTFENKDVDLLSKWGVPPTIEGVAEWLHI